MTSAAVLLAVAAVAAGPPVPVRTFGSTLYRADAGIRAAAVGPADTLFTLSTAGDVLLWDLDVGTARRVGPADCTTDALTPDGRTGVGHDATGTSVVVWDLATGTVTQRLKHPGWARDPDRRSTPAGLRADGRAVVLRGGRLVEELAAGPAVRTVELPASFSGLVFAPDNRRFATRAWSGRQREPNRVVVGDNQTLQPVATLDLGPGDASRPRVPPVAFFPAGDRLLTAAGDKVVVWDVATAKVVAELPPGPPARPRDGQPPPRPTALLVSADGATAFAQTDDGLIRRYDVATGAERSPLAGAVAGLAGLHLLAGGRLLVCPGDDGVIRRWRLDTGADLQPPDGYAGHTSATATADGRAVVVTDGSGRLDLWDAASGVRTHAVLGPADPRWRPGHALPVGVAAGRVFVPTAAGRFIDSWDVATGEQVGRVRAGRDLEGCVPSPDGRRLAVKRGFRTVGVISLDTAASLWDTPPPPDTLVRSLPAFTPDGKTLLVGVSDKHETGYSAAVVRLDAATGAELGRLPLPLANPLLPTAVGPPVVSRDGRVAVARVNSSDFFRLDLPAGRVTGPFPWAAERFAATADGRFLVGDGWDGDRRAVVRFDPLTGDTATLLPAPPGGVESVHLLPGDRQVLLAGFGGRVGVYDLPPWPAP